MTASPGVRRYARSARALKASPVSGRSTPWEPDGDRFPGELAAAGGVRPRVTGCTMIVVGAQGQPMRAERKVVTALFADLVGSTTLAERLDPEDVSDIVGGAIARVVLAVEDFGGTIKDLAGDGALALFGAPIAHEDDPERAVRAGLRIVDDIAAYADEVEREFGVPALDVRVGIETGLVVLGPVGGGSRVEYGATGDAVNTTARLQAAAAPGSVLVGAATHRLVEPVFSWGGAQTLTLKGKEQRVTAYEATALRAAGARVRGIPGTQAPLVGREPEFTTLRQAADAVVAGTGTVVSITGEPGLGKSRLLTELRGFLGTRAAWLEGRCVSYGEGLPYWAFRDLLRDWLGLSPATSEGDAREALRGRLAELSLGDLDLYLAAVLGFGLDTEAETALRTLSPEARQYRTFEAIGSLLRRLARNKPVVVALDDLHWADPTSLQLAERLFALTRQERILLLLAQRPERDHPSWRLTERGPTFIALEALAEGADAELLHRLVGASTLPAELEARVLSAAEGNPFYLEELVRSLADAGALVLEDGGFTFVQEVPVEIPDTVEKVILARIDRLPPAPRDALTAASVLGRQFGLELLRALTGTNGVLVDALAELNRLDLVREERRDAEPEYRFKHALIQEAAYNSLLRKDRRRLHRAAAEAIERLFADRLEQHYGVLAHHRRAAGDFEQALRYHELAADEARRVYAVEEALRHYSGALDVASTHAEAVERQLVTTLLLKRGIVRAQSGEIAGAREDLGDALAAARTAGDAQTELEALNELAFLLAGAADYREALPLFEAALSIAERLGNHAAQVSLLSRLSIVQTNMLQLDRSLDYSQRALELARSIGDRRALALALDSLEVASVMIGDFATVDEIAPQLVELHREAGDLWYLQYALYQWSWVATATAEWDTALARLDEGLAINHRIGDRGGEPVFHSTIAWIERSRGRYGRALNEGRTGVDLARAVGHPEMIAWSASIVGWLFLELGLLDEAREQLESGLETARTAGAQIQAIRALCHLARARWLLAADDSLIEAGERELARVTTPAGRSYLQGADGAIALARVLVARGDRQRAERLVAPVLAAAEQSGWAEVVAGGLLVLGRREDALGTAQRHGLPGIEWEAYASLGRRDAAADVVARLSSGIDDEMIRERFRGFALETVEGGSPR